MEIKRTDYNNNDFYIKSFFNVQENRIEGKNNSYFSKAFNRVDTNGEVQDRLSMRG